MAMRPQDRYKSTTAGAVSANRNYKDTVFRMLFSDKKNLLSLYNAVNSRDYTNPDDLEIVSLENARIYTGANISRLTIQICHFVIYFTLAVNIKKCWIKNLYTHPACKRYLLLILLSFIMVLIQFAMFLSTDFPLLLNICRVSQNWN